MAVHNPTARNFVRGNPQVSKATKVIAPIRGIDTRTILSAGNPEYCIYCFNLLPADYGLQVRRGFREWQIELVNSIGLGVGTVIPFGGIDDDATDDRLFAVTNEGIWNVTDDEGTPVLMLDFTAPGNGGDVTAEAGYGVYTHYTTDAGEQLLFYADSRNGLFQYSSDTDLWTRPSGITGPDLELVDFVMTHKQQLWMVERDTTVGWYLPAGSISGAASPFYFGGTFKHGGNLAGLFTWTIDGGAGVDDYFIAVSRAGDVLPYRGTDPSSADSWAIVGQYFIGAVPKGNRFAATQAGNLYLLSAYGLLSMDEIITGVDGKNINAQIETQKIAAIIRAQMSEYRNEQGWQVNSIPSQGNLLISTPQSTAGVYLQYALNYTTWAWGLWRGVPINSFDEWSGKMYFGTKDNRIMVMDVDVDNALINPPDVINGDAIQFAILTTFQDFGEPALMKRGKYIRPQFVSLGRPNVTARFRYDYDLAEVLNTETGNLAAESLWNVASWNSGIWGSGQLSGRQPVRGGWGMGRYVAIAMSGNSRAPTTLVSWDVIWDTGGPL